MKIMRLKVDTNDLDIQYHKIKIELNDIPHIKLVCEALTKIDKKYNYPSGGRYGYTMESICKCNAKDNLIEAGLKNEESFNIFNKYIGKKTFHTIHKIDINDTNLFILK